MSVLGNWRLSRERRRLADQFVQGVLIAPTSAEVEWLTALTGDRAVALREVTFARRAIALIVAERDALDDRTASDVAHALAPIIEAEARRSAAVGHAWTTRWREYGATLAARGLADAPATRLARVLLTGANVRDANGDVIERATQFVHATRASANESLRAIFGAATLPEDVRPSALRS